jgi:hypothetical protein
LSVEEKEEQEEGFSLCCRYTTAHEKRKDPAQNRRATPERLRFQGSQASMSTEESMGSLEPHQRRQTIPEFQAHLDSIETPITSITLFSNHEGAFDRVRRFRPLKSHWIGSSMCSADDDVLAQSLTGLFSQSQLPRLQTVTHVSLTGLDQQVIFKSHPVTHLLCSIKILGFLIGLKSVRVLASVLPLLAGMVELDLSGTVGPFLFQCDLILNQIRRSKWRSPKISCTPSCFATCLLYSSCV